MSLKVVNVADGFGAAAVPGVADVVAAQVYYRDVSNAEFIAKAVILPATPGSPGNVKMSWMGIAQTINKDFYVDGNAVKWDSKNLDGLMQTNDEIIVTYQ